MHIDDQDDVLLSDASSGPAIPLIVVAIDDDLLLTLRKLEHGGGFTTTSASHEELLQVEADGLLLFNIRMLEAFEDLALLRSYREKRPLQPIIALCSNDDEDFVLEAFKAGATNYVGTQIGAPVLAEILKSYYKLSEAPRLVEIQNVEMLRSMEAERHATEARLQAESSKKLAVAQAEANKRTKEILDALTEGFFIVEKDLTIADVTSRSCEAIFGRKIAGQALGDSLGLEAGREDYMRGAFEQLFEDFMPLEINKGLLPKRALTTDHRTIAFDYTPVLDAGGAPEKVIVAAIDISHEVHAQEQFEQLQKTTEALFRILSDKGSFRDFLVDSKTDLATLRSQPAVAHGKRLLHTLKGNSGVMGLHEVAKDIHRIETTLEENEEHLEPDFFNRSADQIEAGFKAFLKTHHALLQMDWEHTEGQVSLADHEVTTLLEFAYQAEGPHKAEAVAILEKTKLRPVRSMLMGYSEIVERMAQQQGKNIRFKAVGDDLLLDPHRYGPLMKSLVHAVRNSCDHGIEAPEERERLGKNPEGQITFTFEQQREGALQITLADSGGGIRIDKLLAKAQAMGLVKPEDLSRMQVKDALRLIFNDGLSTAQDISETSGRGVGMACIKHEVEALGGDIRIASRQGVGTRIELTVPLA